MLEQAVKPEIKLRQFEGPLDLLLHLIEKNDVDIYDIPISTITSQYMDYIESMKEFDMELASDFLVMGATLVSIKSRMMLPGMQAALGSGEDVVDPREELVISLMRYKRCRIFASDLKERRDKFDGARFRYASTAKSLGITIALAEQAFSIEEFNEAVAIINERNDSRFTDITAKIKHILRKDKMSVKERIKSIWRSITGKGKILFSSLFGKKAEKMDKVVSFLAVLELVRDNKINVEQDRNFGEISIEEKKV
ncbi:MAG: segregation/condensation protein A [Clostridiales bacterium]|nr:segregation/condensation protein A [Clostridiales bacterium]